MSLLLCLIIYFLLVLFSCHFLMTVCNIWSKLANNLIYRNLFSLSFGLTSRFCSFYLWISLMKFFFLCMLISYGDV